MARRRPAGPPKGNGGSTERGAPDASGSDGRSSPEGAEGAPPRFEPGPPAPAHARPSRPPSRDPEADRSANLPRPGPKVRPTRPGEVRVEPVRAPTAERRRLVLPKPGAASSAGSAGAASSAGSAGAASSAGAAGAGLTTAGSRVPLPPQVPEAPTPPAVPMARPSRAPRRPRPRADEANPWVSRMILTSAALTLALVVGVFLRQGDAPIEPDRPPPGPPVFAPTAPVAAKKPRPVPPTQGRAADVKAAPKPRVSLAPERVRRRARKPVWSKERLDALAKKPGAGTPYPPPTEYPEYKRPYDTSATIDEPPYVLVFSRPPGMNVFLNGHPAGMTPLLRPDPRPRRQNANSDFREGLQDRRTGRRKEQAGPHTVGCRHEACGESLSAGYRPFSSRLWLFVARSVARVSGAAKAALP